MEKESFKSVYAHLKTFNDDPKRNYILKVEISLVIDLQKLHSHVVVKFNIIVFVEIEWHCEEKEAPFEMTVWFHVFFEFLVFVYFWPGKTQYQ